MYNLHIMDKYHQVVEQIIHIFKKIYTVKKCVLGRGKPLIGRGIRENHKVIFSDFCQCFLWHLQDK